MTGPAHRKALDAARDANEAIGDLLAFAHGGEAPDSATHYDCTYPLARALLLSLEAMNDQADPIDPHDITLMNALQAWIDAPALEGK